MKGEQEVKKRDFPYMRSGWASVVRNVPTAHEYRSRKNAMLVAIAMILYVGLKVSLKSGTYGIINISNVVILEIGFYISFLWCIYRYRVVCYDRIAEWDEKVISVINQNISVTGTRSWIDMRDRFLNIARDIDDKTRSQIDDNIGSISDFAKPPKGIRITAEFHPYSGLLSLRDLLGRCGVTVYVSKDQNDYKITVASVKMGFFDIVLLLFRSYRLLARWDDSFSEWIAPWILIVISMICFYIRIYEIIISEFIKV